ncbi:MAG TPA: endonuclease/exonuclease/phosphatase family protein [Kofleriaceae bacterium]|nr:endonuclease/exonuclease/phosphatase family protein [Kofleriaceae bacterium]
MKLVALASMLLLACASGDPAPTPSVPRDPDAIKLRVMTYNVNFGLRGDPQGVAAIASASPDLVVLQETTRDWEQALVDGLGATYPHHRFEDARGPWVAGGMGVLSKWPIQRIDTLTDGGGPFFAWRIVVDAPGGPIQILDVHLRPPMSDSGSWVVGFFSTRKQREAEARAHIRALDPALPTLVMGDFNEEDDGMALAVFRGRGFTSALPQFEPNADTWQWPVGSMTLRFRLDHILVDKHFRAVDAAVVDAGRSDHAPVWADLERVR